MNQSMRRNGTDEKIKQFVLETFHVLYFTARRIFEPLDFLISDIGKSSACWLMVASTSVRSHHKGYDMMQS